MEEWDNYWGEKNQIHSHIYDRVAVFYRERIIKPYLKKYIRKYFSGSVIILHAGCGGGQVEGDAAVSASTVGLDISANALTLYRQCHSDSSLILGDITSIAIKPDSIDGIYNLGVMEHFSDNEIQKILMEFHRVLRKDGVVILFWPPRYGLTVIVLKGIHFLLNSVLKKNIYLHPAEPSLIMSEEWVKRTVEDAGFGVQEINFGPADFFTYMVVVIKKNESV